MRIPIRRPTACSAAAAWLCLSLAPACLAQSQPDPLNPQAAVPAPVYASALDRQRQPDAPALAWREANALALRIGGWRAYARAAQATPDTPADTPANTPAVTAPGHHGHTAQPQAKP